MFGSHNILLQNIIVLYFHVKYQFFTFFSRSKHFDLILMGKHVHIHEQNKVSVVEQFIQRVYNRVLIVLICFLNFKIICFSTAFKKINSFSIMSIYEDLINKIHKMCSAFPPIMTSSILTNKVKHKAFKNKTEDELLSFFHWFDLKSLKPLYLYTSQLSHFNRHRPTPPPPPPLQQQVPQHLCHRINILYFQDTIQ